MAQGNHRPGGGLHSKNVVHPGYRHGDQRREVKRAGVAQLGQKKGNHITHAGGQRLDYSGVPIFGGQGYPSKLGNRVAVETTCGPGGSRTVMRSGSQGTQGAPNPGQPNPSGELFPGWPAKR